jgi:bifunctional DNase/RNase
MASIMKLVDLVGIHVEANSGVPLVLLREQEAPHRLVPIFVGGPEAASIAVALSGQAPPRPLAHDVMATLVRELAAHVDAIEVTGVDDGSFQAAISVTGPDGEHRLDTRPSDAIALAIRVGAPVFVSDDVLEFASATLTEEPDGDAIDDAEIDDAVAEFRDFLDDVDPASFANPLDGVAGEDEVSDGADPADDAGPDDGPGSAE